MRHRLLDYRPTIAALEERGSIVTDGAAGDPLRLAAELLEMTDAGTLEPGLARLIGRAAPRLNQRTRARLAHVLARIGRPLLHQTGATPRSLAGQVFGLELEGLSPEDQAFEVARHFGEFAEHAARFASQTTAVGSPDSLAQRSVWAVARRLAPGLRVARAATHRNTPGYRVARVDRWSLAPADSGTWIRRGRQLVVLDS